MTIVIPRAKRTCIQCGASNPEYSQLEGKSWARSDLCPNCFKAKKPEIYWKRAPKEKSHADFSSLVEALREYALSQEAIDQCTGLLLAEFLLRAKVVKRVQGSTGKFRLKDSTDEFQFIQTDFPLEIRKDAQKRINETMTNVRAG